MVYICHKSNKIELLGRNAEEQVMMATVYGVHKDLWENYNDLCYDSYEDDKAFQAKVKEIMPSFQGYLKKLDGLLGDK